MFRYSLFCGSPDSFRLRFLLATLSFLPCVGAARFFGFGVIFPLSFSFILTFALYTDFTGRPSSDEISAQLFPARIIEYTFRSYADSSPGSSALAERASSSPERPSDDPP